VVVTAAGGTLADRRRAREALRIITTRRTRPSRSSRWPGARRRSSSVPDCSAPPCWLRRYCRSRPRTPSARRSGTRPDSTTPFGETRTFYCTYAALVAVGAGAILIPGVPLIPILFLTQALNAILLPPLLVLHDRDGARPAAHGPVAAAVRQR
jgi:hypothetical protein